MALGALLLPVGFYLFSSLLSSLKAGLRFSPSVARAVAAKGRPVDEAGARFPMGLRRAEASHVGRENEANRAAVRWGTTEVDLLPDGLHGLDTRLAELTFDSMVDAVLVKGAADVPRMLTFCAGEVTVDVEVTAVGLMGQVLPPQRARVEVLSVAQEVRVEADAMGRFTSDTSLDGPFALRLRTSRDTVVTQWLRN